LSRLYLTETRYFIFLPKVIPKSNLPFGRRCMGVLVLLEGPHRLGISFYPLDFWPIVPRPSPEVWVWGLCSGPFSFPNCPEVGVSPGEDLVPMTWEPLKARYGPTHPQSSKQMQIALSGTHAHFYQPDNSSCRPPNPSTLLSFIVLVVFSSHPCSVITFQVLFQNFPFLQVLPPLLLSPPFPPPLNYPWGFSLTCFCRPPFGPG